MKQKHIGAAAAIVAAALLSSMLSGCAMFRPIDGSAETTDSTAVMETTFPDGTSSTEIPSNNDSDKNAETQPAPPVTAEVTTDAATTAPPVPVEKRG